MKVVKMELENAGLLLLTDNLKHFKPLGVKCACPFPQ
jgi:hypothetical protein